MVKTVASPKSCGMQTTIVRNDMGNKRWIIVFSV